MDGVFKRSDSKERPGPAVSPETNRRRLDGGSEAAAAARAAARAARAAFVEPGGRPLLLGAGGCLSLGDAVDIMEGSGKKIYAVIDGSRAWEVGVGTSNRVRELVARRLGPGLGEETSHPETAIHAGDELSPGLAVLRVGMSLCR